MLNNQSATSMFLGNADACVKQFPELLKYYNKNNTADDKILIVKISNQTSPSDFKLIHNYYDYNHIIMLVDSGAQATVHHIFNDSDPHILPQCSIDILLSDYSQLTYILDYDDALCLQREVQVTVTGKRSSNFTGFVSHVNGSAITYNYTIKLREELGYAKVQGWYIVHDDQKVVMRTTQEHLAANTTSVLTFKGILADAACAHYNGIIKIAEHARGSQAQQNNKNILLSERARALSIPSLEVKTNDVSCKHGSAVGYFDEDHVFYMQSRGFSRQYAKKFLLQGFIADLVQTIPDNNVQILFLKKIAHLIEKIV